MRSSVSHPHHIHDRFKPRNKLFHIYHRYQQDCFRPQFQACTMSTRPSQSERRTDSPNAKDPTNPHELVGPASVADPLMILEYFMKATPLIQIIMRGTLIRMSYVKIQAVTFHSYRHTMEADVSSRSRPTCSHKRMENGISSSLAIIHMHGSHFQELKALVSDYAEQIVMWGFECSKPKDEWDTMFIERRKLGLKQLNRRMRRLSVSFNNVLQTLLRDECGHLFPSQTERKKLQGALEEFQDRF
jgi:hypothetical protein